MRPDHRQHNKTKAHSEHSGSTVRSNFLLLIQQKIAQTRNQTKKVASVWSYLASKGFVAAERFTQSFSDAPYMSTFEARTSSQ